MRRRRFRILPRVAALGALFGCFTAFAAVLVVTLGSPESAGSQAEADRGDRPAAVTGTREVADRRRPEREAEPERKRKPRRSDAEIDRAAVDWRASTPVGTSNAGSLLDGVRLPAKGRTYVTWDPVTRKTPNRADRRWGTDTTIRTVLEVAAAHRKAFPDGPRMIVGDISRPQGGDFSVAHGDLGDGVGHVSHQNGLDVDIYLPPPDGGEHGPAGGTPEDVIPFDAERSQDLVDRFVAAGATNVFVGTQTGLTGAVASIEPRHNDHIHVRLPAG